MFKMDNIWGKSEKKADLQTVTSGTNLQNTPAFKEEPLED
jgi:hypothetical protein